MEIKRAIFVGPSLYGIDLELVPGEILYGSARAGDILALVRHDVPPRQIVLIDGIFYQDLSVWHKELVLALCRGIVCIGASSMGALRAAELWRYGMIGIGQIFERYKNGEEDDSLVAMSFDPVTYKPLREARVGQEQKCKDALAAIEFARGYKERVKTTLDENAFEEYLPSTLARLIPNKTTTYG